MWLMWLHKKESLLFRELCYFQLLLSLEFLKEDMMLSNKPAWLRTGHQRLLLNDQESLYLLSFHKPWLSFQMLKLQGFQKC